MQKSFQILNAVALVATIVVSYLSNTGVFNGETMATVSARYQNLFTPAGYAFSIWGLIYLSLLGFVIYYGPFLKSTPAKDSTILQIGWWFIISCVCNSLWVITWLYDYVLLTIPIMVVLFIALFKIIVNTKMALKKTTIANNVFLKLPFYIYSGWISIALVANIAAFLKKIQWNGFGISETSWAIIMFIATAVIHLFMIYKRNMPAFGIVAVWALIAIAAANKEVNNTVYMGAIIFAAFIFINVVIQLFKSKKIALNEQ